MSKYPQMMDYHELLELLPYRSPWMLIDRLIKWDTKSLTVQKVISGADPMVASHFPKGPSVIPGVLYIELISQAILLLHALNFPDDPPASTVLARCKADFLSPGFIGDSLLAEVTLGETFAGKVFYDGIVRCEDRNICKVSAIAAQIDYPILSSAILNRE